MKKLKNKQHFNCDVDGGIMVTCALRYALGRMTYVVPAIQDWIKTYWDDLDSQTKFNVVKDIFQHLHENYRIRNDAQFLDVISREWEKFGIDRYWALSYDERKSIDMLLASKRDNAECLKIWMPKLYENRHEL